jgi:DNA gyrase/topoisomerase IV subunit B
VKPDKKGQIKQGDEFFLCMDGKCDTSYFNRKGDLLLRAEDIKVPLWYKDKENKKTACYCNNISFEQVREQVTKNGKTIWRDIVSAYRKKPICKCDLLNPTGGCCTDTFYAVINAALKESGKKPVSQEFIKEFGCC